MGGASSASNPSPTSDDEAGMSEAADDGVETGRVGARRRDPEEGVVASLLGFSLERWRGGVE